MEEVDAGWDDCPAPLTAKSPEAPAPARSTALPPRPSVPPRPSSAPLSLMAAALTTPSSAPRIPVAAAAPESALAQRPSPPRVSPSGIRPAVARPAEEPGAQMPLGELVFGAQVAREGGPATKEMDLAGPTRQESGVQTTETRRSEPEAPVSSGILAHVSPEMAEALDEADFFIAQGLVSDARTVLLELLLRAPKHPEIVSRLGRIASGPASTRAKAG